jgi:hypothetical protein
VRRDHVRRSGADARESRAEEALAADGVPRMRLGYELLVKLKVDELLEREDKPRHHFVYARAESSRLCRIGLTPRICIP